MQSDAIKPNEDQEAATLSKEKATDAKKESKMLSSIQLNQNAFDFFGSFKQLFKESLEYK